jgi:hypothetical protein
MGFSHHLKNVDHWMAIKNGFHSPFELTYLWMVTKTFWLLMVEFGKGGMLYVFGKLLLNFMCGNERQLKI